MQGGAAPRKDGSTNSPPLSTIFLSPIQFKALGQKEFRPAHQPAKTDLFNLGITLLTCATLKKTDDIYDFNSFEIKQDKL